MKIVERRRVIFSYAIVLDRFVFLSLELLILKVNTQGAAIAYFPITR